MEGRASPHIHTPDDGRGFRHVYVDGKQISSVMWADTKRGIVVAAMEPLRADKWRKRVLTRKIRGDVTIRWPAPKDAPA